MVRPKIPQKTVDELMFETDHTCSICQKKGKPVHINHIDGNPSNNKISNLIVLCLEHHDEVSRKSPIGKGYSAGELRKYKNYWEYQVKKRRGLIPSPKKPTRSLSPIEDTITEVLSLPDGDKRAIEKLNKLYEIFLWLGYDEEIIDGLEHLSLMAGLGYTKLTVRLCWLIYEFNQHFVGPEDVPIKKEDEKRIKRYIDCLETIGKFAGEFNRKISIISALCENLFNFHILASTYNKESLELKIIKALSITKKSCLYKFEKGEKRFLKGSREVGKTLKKILKSIKQERPKWRKALSAVRNSIN